jgi:hypothetical protein
MNTSSNTARANGNCSSRPHFKEPNDIPLIEIFCKPVRVPKHCANPTRFNSALLGLARAKNESDDRRTGKQSIIFSRIEIGARLRKRQADLTDPQKGRTLTKIYSDILQESEKKRSIEEKY